MSWCGDRRTVFGREGPVSAALEFGGFVDVPHRVSINKSAGYGFLWNRIWTRGRSSESYALRLEMLGEERPKTTRSLASDGELTANSNHS